MPVVRLQPLQWWAMPRRLEKVIENYVVLWAKRNGILVFKLNLWGNNGWPDRAFMYNGKCVFIEFKRPGEKAEPLQDHHHRMLRAHSFEVYVCEDKHVAIAILEASLLSGASRQADGESGGSGAVS